MIIPLDKLLLYGGNKYIFTKAAMAAVEKIGNMKKYPEEDSSWKVVPNILKLVLDEEVQFEYHEEEIIEEEIE